ncbi:AraC family transcriptional regulator [Streptomyces roseirectus]|uniref:AraC family transcriptional regulator n=1 Tax=Streptomyces roseirectus TaxID=2768066 RepID=A0A7H0IDT2_9ACTN|nr:helix-turn-helix domain-containing protein [Streptomyces roseirectus]QNP70948.1 AraC family transcriptional regulator [Streptomyces roseirectus]
MAVPDDTRGIVDPAALLTRVRFRRRLPAPALRPYIERYWLIDWDLPIPYTSRVIPHPSINLTFQWDEETGPPYTELTGIPHGSYVRTLTGRGRVCGVKFRPGAFSAFTPGVAATGWTGRVVRLGEDSREGSAAARPVRKTVREAIGDEARGEAHQHPSPFPLPHLDLTTPASDDARAAALDAHFLALPLALTPQIHLATRLVDLTRETRDLRKVSDVARAANLSSRSLQRLFAAHVGVTPKWVILRYRLHEALDHAATDPAPDWPALAADLGYADQAHLTRAFTKTLGLPPPRRTPRASPDRPPA